MDNFFKETSHGNLLERSTFPKVGVLIINSRKADKNNMPFVQQTPRAFTRENIEALKSNQFFGVYGLFKEGVWIYVGRSDIRKRLLDHFNGDNPCIIRSKPTHWVDEVIDDSSSLREKQLISELSPICNEKLG